MTSSESLVKLYQLFSKLQGPTEARDFVSTVVFLVINDIQEEGLELTPEIFNQKVSNHVNDYLEVAKSKKIA